MPPHDYYQVLGVERDAGAERIRQAYRRLARKHHPDLNPGDAAANERFRRLGEAYEVLSDPAKRRRYDAFRASGAAGPRPGRTWSAHGSRGAQADWSGLFSGMFGSRPGRGWEPRPPETSVEVRLEEVLSGAFRQVRTGSGEVLRVRIPPGVADGTRLRIPTAEGAAHIRVRVAGHPQFRRSGDDLEVDVPVRFAQAALGGEIEVPTLEGTERVRLAAGTSGGAGLRLRGRGLPTPGSPGKRGDLVARIQVTVPDRLTPEEREWIRKMDPADQPKRG